MILSNTNKFLTGEGVDLNGVIELDDRCVVKSNLL